jgi:hypothetical protein
LADTRRLIVTADDFGASPEVNAAVEQAHLGGILTAASLMVGGDAAGDAVERARRLPGLGVGLHLVLVEGRPLLPPEQIPALVDGNGQFRSDMVRTALTIFALPSARRQLAAEIDAQFAAFAATGLKLDHVNAHKHFHLHPTIASAILRAGKRYGMTAMRAPIEPPAVIAAIDGERLERRDRTSLGESPAAAPAQGWRDRAGSGLRAGVVRRADCAEAARPAGPPTARPDRNICPSRARALSRQRPGLPLCRGIRCAHRSACQSGSQPQWPALGTVCRL